MLFLIVFLFVLQGCSDQQKGITVESQALTEYLDTKHMEWMSGEVRHGRFFFCPNGSHLSQYDDQRNYFEGVVKFIRDVDSGNF